MPNNTVNHANPYDLVSYKGADYAVLGYIQRLLYVTGSDLYIPDWQTTVTLASGDSISIFNNVKRIFIPQNIVNIIAKNNMFPNLEEIIIDPMNTHLKSSGPMLIRDGQLRYVFSAGMKDVCIVPANITAIAYGAFSDTICENIKFENPHVKYHPNAFDNSRWIDVPDARMVGDALFLYKVKGDVFQIPVQARRFDPSLFESLFYSNNPSFKTIISHEPLSLDLLSLTHKSDIKSHTTIELFRFVTTYIIDRIKDYAFLDTLSYFPFLERITLNQSDDCSIFKTVDGILYSSNMKILYYYPPGKRDDHYQIPDGVEMIEAKAFMNQRYLKRLTMPNSIHHIGESIFQGCKRLADVSLSDNINVIPKSAFYCSLLKQIRFPQKLTAIESNAFWGTNLLIRKQCFVIPEGVTAIDEFAFKGNPQLKLVFPSTLSLLNGPVVQEVREISVHEGTAKGLMSTIVSCSKTVTRICLIRHDGSQFIFDCPPHLSKNSIVSLNTIWNNKTFDHHLFELALFNALSSKGEKLKYAETMCQNNRDDGRCFKYIQRSRYLEAKSWIENSDEPKVIELLKLKLFKRDQLKKLLSMASQYNLVTVIPYIMEYLNDDHKHSRIKL